MNTIKLVYILISLSFIYSSCESNNNSNSTDKIESERDLFEKKYTGEKKYYYKKSKKLRRVENYKDGRKHGKLAVYYENGKEKEVTNYVNGKKEGKYGWYYESGKPYLTIDYKNNVYNGEYTRYHYSGKPSAIGNFHNGKPCKGFTEFDVYGKKLTAAKITVTDKGYNYNTEKYIFHLTLNTEAKNLRFYVGKLDKEGCFNLDLIEDPIRVEKNIGIIEIPLVRDEFIMTPVTFIAVAKVKYDIEAVFEINYNLVAEVR